MTSESLAPTTALHTLVQVPNCGAEAEAWRREVRRFLSAEMARDAINPHLDSTELTGLTESFERAHHRRAGAHGYLGIAMPVDIGGGGRPPSWKALYDFEAAYHDAPSIDTGVTLCGHALAHHGSAAQRAGELAAMIAGTMTGCIAYTEEYAGSDLGALTTSAAAADGGWILDGRKTLVTGAHRADVCLTLARTSPDGPPKSSMTMFLVPMTAPGIRVTRRPTINGWTLEDIEFDHVVVPADRVVGEVGEGWRQMLGALGAERAGLAYLGWATRRVEELLAISDDPRLIDLVIAHGRARRFSQRVLTLLDAGEPLGHTGAVAKLVVTELLQDIARVGAELTAGLPVPAQPSATATLFTGRRFAFEQLERLHATIGAGTSEIQRDAIARFLPALVDARSNAAVSSVGRDGAAAASRTSPNGAPEAAVELGLHARNLLGLAWRRMRERTQFGQSLSEFQVLRHRLVDALVDVESIELAVAEIAAGADDEQTVAANLLASISALRVAAAAHQICGGWGYLNDAGLGPSTRRIHDLAAASHSFRRTLTAPRPGSPNIPVGDTWCLACGFDLGVPPWVGDGGSHEICLSCGLHFGYDDAAARGEPDHAFYRGWRSSWLAHGARWWSTSPPPADWDPHAQLRRLSDR